MRATRGRYRFAGLVRFASLVALIGLVACQGGRGAGQETKQRQVSASQASTAEVTARDFDAKNFSHSTKIDNIWLPLVPGMQLVWEGEANRGGGVAAHRGVLTVTDLTKVINGVRTLVIWERDYNGGSLVETEIAFYAQDDEGNVWLLGEYPEEYDDGKFEGAPSAWIAGLAKAEAGVIMPANPREGEPPYLQGLAPDVDFQDLAKVHKVGQEVCVPAGCYKNVMVIDEWDPLAEPQDGHALKYQAPRVGNVRVESVGGEEEEVLVLVEFSQLSADAMAEARGATIKLDKHAYEANARWEQTPPVEPMS